MSGYRKWILSGMTTLLFITPSLLLGAIEYQWDLITMDQVYRMGHSVFIPEAGYRYSFVNGAGDISDGSDFDAVRRAFGTWASDPGSALWAQETRHTSAFTPGTMNWKNEIAWIGPTSQDSNPWKNVLNFSSKVIAAVKTWFYADSKKVVERDLYFNDVDMAWRTATDGQQEGGFFVEHIALHEIGHIFGLMDVCNPGQNGYEDWMGMDNAGLTMYGYSNWMNEDVTLSATDAAAMALLHPAAAVPEAKSSTLFMMGGGILLVFRRKKS